MGKYTFKGKAAVSVAAIAALTLTGCASVGGGGSEGGGESSAAGQEGGVVTVAETNAFSGANPSYTKTNLDINNKIAQMTREGFYTVDTEQKIQPNEGFGTYKKISDDPLTVEYELKDPQWSDGNKIDKVDLLLEWSMLSGYANDSSEDGKTGKDYFSIAGSTDILGTTEMPTFSEDGKKMTITDSRVPTMQDALFRMLEHYDRQEILGLYNGLAKSMDEAKSIKPNLDYPAGPTYWLMGFDIPTFTPIFVCARIAGWTAHIMEQRANNSLIRPLSDYNGPDERHLS